MSKLNLREKILNAKDIKEEKVFIKEWDAELLVKGMTGKERANFIKSSNKGKEPDYEAIYTSVVISNTFDPETGDKVFGIADKGMLLTKSSGALEILSQKILELSGIGEQAQEEAEKN